MLVSKSPLPRWAALAAAKIFHTLTLAAALLSGLSAVAADAAGSISERPLAPHPEPRGKTMFSELPASETGIKAENKYADPRMWGDLFREFEGGSFGTGIAIGDYDGDGRPDIFVVSKTESCHLFRNLGNFKFEDVTDKAGVGDKGDAAKIWKQGVTFVDVNNDGLLDIYVCRFNAPNLLYINQGNGTFKEMARSYGLDVKDASVMASFCDYDRDGWLDVYIATNMLDVSSHPSGQRGYLFHNNGNGTFTNVTDQAGISGEAQSHSATWWDYDNDGWPDLYVALDYGVPDRLYHNNRDGTFSETINTVLPHTSFSSMGADVGDINNDGHLEFFVADMAATSHQKDQHSFAEGREKNEDPDKPLVAQKVRHNALLLSTGTGRFLEAAYLAGIAATDWTWSVRFEDLDNDGREDLTVTNGFPRDPSPDLYKRMMSAESPEERRKIMFGGQALIETHLTYRNLGDLQFENVSTAWGLDQKGISFGAALGDLGGDGNMDILYSNYRGGITFLRNDNDSGHRVNIDLRGTLSNRFGVGATVRVESTLGLQVRQLQLARGYMSSSEPMLHFGLGNDTVIQRLTISWPSGHVQTFVNLPVDRRFTITEPSSTAPQFLAQEHEAVQGQFTEVSHAIGLEFTSREEPVDEIAIQRLLPVRLNRRGPGLAVGDINGDGIEDVVIGGTTVVPLHILFASKSGTFASSDTAKLATGSEVDDGPLLLFDANGDGNTDLLVTKGGNSLSAGAAEYQPRLFLNDGSGGFKSAPDETLPLLPISVGAVAAADFDHGGRLGLFIGGRILPGQYPLAPQSALLANHGGKFEDVTDTLAPGLREVGMVTSALWSDVDGDGWLDLLLTLEWGTVKYFHNNQGKGFEDWTEKAGFAAAGTGWWTSIASADFNGDGVPDYAVGNLGLNTPYHADPQHPVLLYSGDFKGDGSTQLIEAYYEGEKLYPRRSRKGLASAIPSIMKRFPLNANFAKATLGEILGESKVAAAKRFAATEFRSGVFLSQTDGTYLFSPLPNIAQIAPIQGMVTGDFDGDGLPGIYAVQNSYAPIPCVGRFDGGLSQALRGNGHGHFSPVPPEKSGLLVPGDAKALVVIDLDHDGRPDFFVTRNNDSTLAYRNSGVSERRFLCVHLQGLPGNPTAVGARLTVELMDGSTQTSEVFAGSGYYSQSSPACYFGYREGDSPKKITIRWPRGQTTEHAISADSSSLSIQEPSW